MVYQHKILGNSCTVLLLFVFSYSLFSKIFNFNQFTADILTSPLIPGDFTYSIRYGVPGIELLIIILIISRQRIIGYYLAFFSLVVFTTYYILFYRVAQSNCGCGKLFDSLGFYPHLAVNILLLIACVYLIYNPAGVWYRMISSDKKD